MPKKFTNAQKRDARVTKNAIRMRKNRTFLQKLLLPPPQILLIFILPAVIFFLPVSPFERAAPRLLALLLSGYVLLSLTLRLPRLWRAGLATLQGSLRAPERRARALLVGGLLLNLGYAVFRTVTGLFTHSLWFCTESIYYTVLSTVRFFFVEEDGRKNAAKSYRLGGYLLLLLSLSVVGTVTLAVRERTPADYPDHVIVLTVLFTLWRVVAALCSLLRFHRRRLPVPLLAKATSLSAAAVSLFGLQGTLLTRYAADPFLRRRWNVFTGCFVCFSLPVMALFILKRGREMQ